SGLISVCTGSSMVVQNLEDLVTSLLDCVASLPGCDAVRTEVQDSMTSLSIHQPSILLSSSHAFLLKNPKLSASSRAFIIRCMCSVANNQKVLETLDEQLLLLIINLATQEMTLAKDSESEWSDAAQELLVRVASSNKFAVFVLDALLQKFPPGLTTGPHKNIVATFGAVAQHNAFGFVPFLTDIFSRAVPLLPHIKTEATRCAWARAICAFCESIRECESGKNKLNEEEEEEGEEENGRECLEHEEIVSRFTYSDQAEAAYDVVVGWMTAKDLKVRAEAAECVGELCTIMNRQKVTDEMKRLVTTVLGLYKKALPDQYHLITQGICRILESICMDEVSTPLDAYVDDLLNALFPHACLDADDVSSSPNAAAIKNHSEAFRCFHVAASRYADRIVYYLLHKMQNVQDIQKLGAINVLRHLLNSSASTHMDDKRALVMMGLRKLLATEQNMSIRVCRAMVQLCVALADHSFIDSDGGDHVIAFLVRNLVATVEGESGQARRPDSDMASVNQLKTQSAQALHTISSTCPSAAKLLFPYLLEFICIDRYTPVMADLSKCIRVVLQRDAADNKHTDYVTGFDNPKVAGSFAVFTRLIVCQANAPLNGFYARRSRESLSLIKSMAGWFHSSQTAETIVRRIEHLEALIDDVTGASAASGMLSPLSPRIGEGAQGAPERRAARVARWHDAVLTALDSIVSSVAEGEWRQEVALSFVKQMDLYTSLPDEKALLMRALGVVLSRIANHHFVTEHIMLLFRSANHSSSRERKGCAQAIGAVGKVHTDLLLIELENVAKWEHAKKKSGYFSSWRTQYSDTEMVNLRATLMLSYGYLVQACPLETVCQYVEQTVIVFLRHYMANQKQETVVREALLESMYLIGSAVHPSRLGTEYSFPNRSELIAYVKDYVQTEQSETLSSALRLLACKAASVLVRLDPRLSETEVWELGNALVTAVLPINREKSGLKTLSYDVDVDWRYVLGPAATTAAAAARLRHRIEDDSSSTTMEATVTQLAAFLVAVISTSPTIETVTLLLKMLRPFYNRAGDHERSRAVDLTVVVLRTYYEHASDIKLGTASEFGPLSCILGRLSPRLVDSLSSVRVQSLHALHQALRLAHAHKGHGLETGSSVVDVGTFVDEVHLAEEGKMDGQTAKMAVKRFGEIIESRLPQSQIQTYLSAIFEMLSDRQSQVSSAAAQLLTQILSTRGASLHAEAETLVTTLLSKLPEVHGCVQTYSELLSALVAFSLHQQVIVTDVLLKQPLPYSTEVSNAWECLCRDRSLYPSLVEYTLELTATALEDPHTMIDTGGGAASKLVRQEVCAYVAALHEIVKGGDIECILSSPSSSPSSPSSSSHPSALSSPSPHDRLSSVMVVLLQLLFSLADCQFPVVAVEGIVNVVTPELRRVCERPAGLVTNALRALLTRTRVDGVLEEMNTARAWTECTDRELHVNAVTRLLRSLCDHRPLWVEAVVRGVQMKEQSEREPLRAASVAVVAAIIDRCPARDGSFNGELFDDCVASLQRALKDQSLRIRKLSIRGMGELADRATRYASVCVDAAMAGLDDVGDRKDEVATESIVALNKLIGNASDTQLRAILPQVLLKVRPCFDKESSFLRAAAFRLFGEMAARVGAVDQADFLQHLHANIVIILLHMNEEDQEVRKACTSCMAKCAPIFGNELVEGVAKVHLCPSLSSPDSFSCSSYSLFVRETAMALTACFPDRVNGYALTTSNYFKSSQSRIRAGAAQLTGHLLDSLTPQIRSTISRDIIFGGLVLLLKDVEDVSVRVATARAIASLHSYV
ncbi:hypothetical protein PENTCL1PPCAC_23407, partial [Pristionchus entomophagus]